MPKPILPEAKEDGRVHPRYELFASVELRRGGEILVLPARNISLGGLYLAADGNDLSSLSSRDLVEVVLFDAADEGQATVRAPATIVRKDPTGLAMTWASTDPVVSHQLASMLERFGSV